MTKMYLLPNLCLFIFCFGATNQSLTLWPLFLPFAIFFLFLSLLNSWLVPGGFAWRNHHRNSPQLRGPIGWPLLGSISHMSRLAHRKLAEISASLDGDANRLMAISLGATRVIISSHPDTAKEILSGSAFSDRPMKESARLLMFERAIGFAPSGDYWRHLRRIAANHMFSPKRVAALEGLRRRIADDMVDQVWKEMESRGEVEPRGILHKGSLSNVIESVFGRGLCSDGEQLGSMVREGYDLIAQFNLEDYFPLGFLDFYGVKRRCHKLAARVKCFLGEIIKERRKEECKGRDDFLSVLLTLPKEDQLNDSDMVSVLWEMIFRGTDTIAILLEWIIARMVLHPDVQAKAQQEIDECMGSHREVQDSDIPSLPYLQAIVKEVLRLHPPGPLLSWARLAIHDVHVGKFFVPAGTAAMVNMWAITHDESIWKDPLAFKPERFIEEDVGIMGSDLRLAPFGSGRRVCPGKTLGLATVHLWLAQLLHRFTWLPAQPIDLSECLRLSLEKKQPLACHVVPRESAAFM
ncbi:PREDICTED: cytochrome P450 78A5-like [Nelumbo nucifera]|uniref:Cytochrome P450 78A5-like n=1 Tax=Nelumbo nucifera TaxID=4432 RepID=A0A1U7ZCP8_NELNU|nr:PREDICTED: cytochrome P450 78A5-like [Nelumbo nucifera]